MVYVTLGGPFALKVVCGVVHFAVYSRCYSSVHFRTNS